MTLPRPEQFAGAFLTETEGNVAYSPKDNFAGPIAPVNPQAGWEWWDSLEEKLKVYNAVEAQ